MGRVLLQTIWKAPSFKQLSLFVMSSPPYTLPPMYASVNTHPMDTVVFCMKMGPSTLYPLLVALPKSRCLTPEPELTVSPPAT